MKLPTRKIILTACALATLGTMALADLGGKAAARISGSGSGLGKSSAPAPSWLGVAISEAPVEISGRLPIEPGTGLVVGEVIAGSPAAISGLQRGDVLARLNDQTLVTVPQLQKLVMRRKTGEQVEITYFRKGVKRQVVVVLMPRERP